MSTGPPPAIRLGTSAFTAAGWEGTFYPAEMERGEAIRHYSEHFDTVEVDSSFYRIPNLQTVKGWAEKTPPGFLFALKVPRVITHEKVLTGAERDLWEFLSVLDPLGDKLGPLLLQFPYFNKKAFPTVDPFLDRLRPFLARLPKAYRFALETRNKNWLKPPLLGLLREHGVALAMVDHPWLFKPREWVEKIDPITADFTYVRWVGDRKKIEEETRTWDKTIVDRTAALADWVDVLRGIQSRGIQLFAFANNHYGGHAPDTVRQFRDMWSKT